MSNTVLNKKIVHNHNKKRNVGLIYEFLIRSLTKNIIENNSEFASTSLKILKTHFHKNSEIYKEFRLLNSLFVTTVSSKAVAANIIAEARNVALNHDTKKINKEKSLLIKDINYNINNESFYKQNVDDYKMYATIQSLLKDWRSSTPDIAKVAVLEDNLTEWILTKKQGIKDLESQKSKDVNDTIISVMSEKISKKYHGVLNDSQQDLIKEYVISIDGNNDKLSSAMSDIRATTQSSIKNYMSSNSDSFINEKFDNVLKIISSSDINMINDVNISHHLSFLKLVEEIAV